MKKITFIFLIISLITLTACQSEIEKADELRLENKFDEAAELYQKAAEEGNAYAMWRLAKAYLNGYGVDLDYEKAIELLNEASQNGCEEAKSDLAFSYMFDWFNLGEDKDKGKSLFDDLVKTSKNSYVLSRYASLLLYENDMYEEDKEMAMRILNKVEDKNNPNYLFLMGRIYLFGTDKIDIDVEKAIEYYTKSFINGGYTADDIAAIYAEGYGSIKADKSKMLEWLIRGIEREDVNCMNTMANTCLSEDSAYQVVHNPQRGVELLKRAARHGSGEAYWSLGNLYYQGEYLPKDDKKAFENWEKSADLGYYEGLANLAYSYLIGFICEKNVDKAIELYKKSVDKGSGFSANKLYCFYCNGEHGLQKDKEQAKKYLLLAAKLNDDVGCFNLAKEYYLGNGLMNKDYGQAFVYMKKAADMEYIDACSALSYFYENGIGVDKNPQKAKEYKDKTIANSENEEKTTSH